ncbi:MAG: histidine kinase [Pelobium sp.]
MKSFKITVTGLQLLAIHLVFWVMLFLPVLLFKYNGPSNSFSEYFLYRMLFSNLLLAVLFYANAFYFFPIIFKNRGILIYALTIIAFITAVWLLTQYVDNHLFPVKKKWGRPFYLNIISYFFILGISCSYVIITAHLKQQKDNKEKETENLKTELSFLRSQVSPHFMFNVLNNLVSLARKKSEKMEPALLQLSSLLRYMLYEGTKGKISLTKEIGYLQGYIDLQKLRFGDDVDISFNVEGNTDDFELEPMLLIPFVENAFKHGMGNVAQPKILISLKTTDKNLLFEVENDITAIGESKDESSGIGLVNTKRRLALLYKNHHQLKVAEKNNKYKVLLNLQLND